MKRSGSQILTISQLRLRQATVSYSLIYKQLFSVHLGNILSAGGPNHANTEIFDVKTKTWNRLNRFPFAKTIANAPIVATNTRYFYMFGGELDDYKSDIISRFDGAEWTLVGRLNSPNELHNVIYDGELFVTFGGWRSHSSEKCSLIEETVNNSTFDCTKQAPRLVEYVETPALFLVPHDFCI